VFGRISAREWNDHLLHLGTRYPIHPRSEDADLPKHAWQVRPQFDATRRRWTAIVRAGSVNGRIATVDVPFGRLPETTQDWLRLSQPTRVFRDTTVAAVPLDFDPPLDLGWREIGGDSAPLSVSESGGEIQASYEPIPQFFQNQGVRRAGQAGPPPPETRRLFASDIVLRQPRAFLTNEISSLPGGLLGGSILSVNPVPSTPQDVREPARVINTARFVVPAVSNTFADIFFQRFLDEPTDELHLSTVYALSQPLEAGGSFPTYIDESFTLQTRYYCHYNLAHATRTLPRVRTPPITLVTGLAAGLGDVLFNSILATANDFAQATLDLFNQRSLRGSFWVV
jgi:hypothetical protein